MQVIYADQARLSQLSESSQGEKFAEDDISTVLTAHNNALSTEFKSFSLAFEDILNESMEKDCDDNLTCSPPQVHKLTLAAQVTCWLRLSSIIRNPPAPKEQMDFIASFASNARTIAHEYLSKSMASKVISIGTQLLSSRRWTEKIPEENLWEGISILLECLIIGDPRAPVQPTRIPVQLLRELCSRLISLGIEHLNPEFVLGTMRCCREGIAAVYAEMNGDISANAALQLLADLIFLETSLASTDDGEFDLAKQKLSAKV